MSHVFMSHKGAFELFGKRSEASLGLISSKFLALLKDSECGVEINEAASKLGVKRRRVYDVVNILRGAGLIRPKRQTQPFGSQALLVLVDVVPAVAENEVCPPVSEIMHQKLQKRRRLRYPQPATRAFSAFCSTLRSPTCSLRLRIALRIPAELEGLAAAPLSPLVFVVAVFGFCGARTILRHGSEIVKILAELATGAELFSGLL
ncbi:predicted protein [Nematostella vectensis]|uniref:E2F/DP family winged-helix DNA-binding domain-containing protein n=1 Tax=Nematostella vectensis TaxID=45351 RepID=A7RPF5_NEMVE|nr:predicted protein [Nematostella vectensis]|eukprot:XP_001638790.1 predicted protein [Nematostella vectensis]